MKNLMNLGTPLTKAEQNQISGGKLVPKDEGRFCCWNVIDEWGIHTYCGICPPSDEG